MVFLDGRRGLTRRRQAAGLHQNSAAGERSEPAASEVGAVGFNATLGRVFAARVAAQYVD
jgi:hypothetical protein